MPCGAFELNRDQRERNLVMQQASLRTAEIKNLLRKADNFRVEKV